MKKNKLKIRKLLVGGLVLCSLAFNLASCTSFLNIDEYIYDKSTLDSVFHRRDLLKKYIIGASNLLPNEGNLFTNSFAPYGLASDECFASWRGDGRHAGMFLLLDELTPFDGYFNNWGTYYKGIRKANLVIERISECPDISDMERRDFIGQAYFLRGYFYYSLVQQYGPVPILPDKAFEVSLDEESLSVERSSYDDCVKYICENLERAAEYLPEMREAAFIYIPTKGVALSIMSRLQLYAASPWFNGNKFYSDWLRSDGSYFINQERDNHKWALAAITAKRVIASNQYSLHTIAKSETTLPLPSNISSANFPNGAGDIDPYLSYSGLFTGETPSINNTELIYGIRQRIGGDSPSWIAAPYMLGGGNGLNLTQDLIDAFRMADGCDINNSSEKYPYPNTVEGRAERIGVGYRFSDYYEMRPDVPKMYDNREPRFYAAVGFCHRFWPGTAYTGTDQTVTNVELTYYSNGNALPPSNFKQDYNRSGYTCVKYMHPEDNLKTTGTIREKVFPIMRYAEILLNYVEALNELEESYTDEDHQITVSRDKEEMKYYFNQIRYRAGQPSVTDEELKERDVMRKLIKRERQLEFVCEGKRYHDLRRWGEDAMDAYNKPIYGMNINARSTEREKYYQPIPITENIARRKFSHKMYLYPIPQLVLNKNLKLVQNPNW